jgi:hypothetical protein
MKKSRKRSEIAIKDGLAKWLTDNDYCTVYDRNENKFYGLIGGLEREKKPDWLVGLFAEYLLKILN